MPINHLNFVDKMIKHFSHQYNDLPLDLVCDIIEEVLLTASENYFSYNLVQEHPEFCKQCGACCKSINCEFFNGRTCDEYATRYDACAEWPYYEINTGDFDAGLMLDPYCNFAVELAIMKIDERLKEYRDLNE